jgi:hypothetical protein
MFETGVPLHVPAPAPDGPIACSLHLNEVAGRLQDFRQMRRAPLAVMAAECDSPTDCSCGLGGPLPALGLTE